MTDAWNRKWIGVDFDETLRRYDDTPVEPMVDRVKRWLSLGVEVRIITARVSPIGNNDGWKEKNGGEDQEGFIRTWCRKHIGQELAIQWGKSPGLLELWDDKVVAVMPNTGRRLSPSKIEADRCDDCDWTFGCFSGAESCRKQPSRQPDDICEDDGVRFHGTPGPEYQLVVTKITDPDGNDADNPDEGNDPGLGYGDGNI